MGLEDDQLFGQVKVIPVKCAFERDGTKFNVAVPLPIPPNIDLFRSASCELLSPQRLASFDADVGAKSPKQESSSAEDMGRTPTPTPPGVGLDDANNSAAEADSHVDRTQWLAIALRKHPELVELRERLRPLSRAESFGRMYASSRTEREGGLSNAAVMSLIVQHLHFAGYESVATHLEEASGIKAPVEGLGHSQLVNLLRLAVRNSDKVFDLATADSRRDEFDPEVELTSHLYQLGMLEEETAVDQSNIWSEPPDCEENFVMDNNIAKAGTLNKLVERLTYTGTWDNLVYMRFMKTFLMTYRSFSTPEILLSKLIQRYHVPPSAKMEVLPIQLRVGNVISTWIDKHFEDFDEKLLSSVTAFVDTSIARDGHSNLAKKIRASIDRQKQGRTELERTFDQPPPEPKIPKSIWAPNFDLWDVDEEEIARQLTLLGFSTYQKIQPVELLNQAWNKPKLKHRSKNVLDLIARFNEISHWVANSIVRCERLRVRRSFFVKFLNIAHYLRGLNDFNTMMAIFAGLNNSAIHRLKYTKEDLPRRTEEWYQEMGRLLSNDNSYSKYREALRSCDPPAFPYLGVYLTDLTFIEDGNPDETGAHQLINFAKRQLVATVISDVQQFSQTPYNLLAIPQIQRELRFRPMDSLQIEQAQKDLYQQSLLREPRGCDKADLI